MVYSTIAHVLYKVQKELCTNFSNTTLRHPNGFFGFNFYHKYFLRLGAILSNYPRFRI